MTRKKDLLVWQKGSALVKSTYQISQAFSGDERFGLTAQIRRAAVSIPSNIAEGQALRKMLNGLRRKLAAKSSDK